MKKLTIFSIILFAVLSAILLAIIFYPGHASGMIYDIEEYKLLKRAGQGDVSAQCSLGRHYERPSADFFEIGVLGGAVKKPNYQQALIWYRKAAEQGNSYAQYRLGEFYEKGTAVKKDIKQAILWFGKSAACGSDFAQIRLVKLHIEAINANNIRQDDWFRQGAAEGYAVCQYQLALCYKYGQGVKKDYKEAARWFRQGADNGDYDCQYELGRCYAQGEGVSRDLAQAVFWYREAAEQGHADAQKALKAMGK
ncbi:MAG: tetratricopeptide repeat protein [bacterium]|nr:tetratricopeptide repeat protein [bacterium]